MESRFSHSPEFVRLARGDEQADLSTVALEIAADANPGLDVRAYIARVDAWGARARERCADGMGSRHLIAQINYVLYHEEKLRGNADDYYDPRNSHLNAVIDRKLGIPITLSILYMAVAERVGLRMAGVDLPGHFVLRTGSGNTIEFVDAYYQGITLDRAGCERRVAEATGKSVVLDDGQVAPCGSRAIVARLLRNLKAIYLRSGRYEESLPVLRRLVLLTRYDVLERRDLGVACVRANRPGEAVDHLEAYAKAHPDASDGRAVADSLRAARRMLADLN